MPVIVHYLDSDSTLIDISDIIYRVIYYYTSFLTYLHIY